MGFHVPRVTISIDFGKEASFGELSLISLGYGLHQAWIYSSMFDKGGIFGTAPLEVSPLNEELSLAYFMSILVYGMLLLIASALDTKLIRFFHATPTLVGAAALGTAGTLLLLLPASAGWDTEMTQIASGVLTGAGSSVLLIAWGIAFARRDSASIVINGALSIAIGFGIYGVVLHQLPFPIGAIASALIPVAEMALLLVLRSHVSLDFDNRRLVFSPLPINQARFVFRFGLPVFFLGVALGVLRQTSIETVLPGAGFEDQAILFVTACCAMVLIMVTFLALGGNERWHTFFRPLIPFIAVTAVFIPVSAGSDSVLTTSVVLIGYMTFEALMWIFFAELSQRFRLSPIFVFGLGRGVMALATLGGSLLPVASAALPGIPAVGETGLVILVIVAMMVAYALLPEEREMMTIVSTAPCVKLAARTPGTPLVVANFADRSEENGAAEAGAAAGAAGTAPRAAVPSGAAAGGGGNAAHDPQAVASSADEGVVPDAQSAANSAGVAHIAASATGTDASAAPVPPTTSSAGATPAASAGANVASPSTPASPDPSATAAAPLGAATVAAPAASSASAASAGPVSEARRTMLGETAETDDEGARMGRFRLRCEAVANTYLLSRRESEVLYYLARGYKSASIQQQLYISEGTAKTHIRHIYRKLNVHNQQELILLIDEVEL
ncbi:LuxR C-terminal-related transcriptional regulator [Adlercreutzia caecimuris]|uniref:LuxR C-terminal-related transcriptional regulator n=1 Tax=Adlercreutzia caecimuris TaxID=671266 RepID=UPI0020CD8542|nr:LuxR C-terminal-related transcriptional regulator [Adlercreutzia caecimuris]MCR2038415.1 LuxR C-terminal-related transcriptional regulator [Adlercreutzia caecimuris]